MLSLGEYKAVWHTGSAREIREILGLGVKEGFKTLCKMNQRERLFKTVCKKLFKTVPNRSNRVQNRSFFE